MRFISCVLAFVLSVAVSHATIINNGDFSQNGTGWLTVGNVQFNGSAAVMGDSTTYNVLYQYVQLAHGNYTYQFSLNSTLGAGLPPYIAFRPDQLVASLYFIDDLSTLDPANPVFDQTMHFVTQSGPAQGGQQDFTFNFNNQYNYVFAAFELIEGNTLADSRVLVDNVSITGQAPIVPEPATLMLVGGGLAGIGIRRRRRAS